MDLEGWSKVVVVEEMVGGNASADNSDQEPTSSFHTKKHHCQCRRFPSPRTRRLKGSQIEAREEWRGKTILGNYAG